MLAGWGVVEWNNSQPLPSEYTQTLEEQTFPVSELQGLTLPEPPPEARVVKLRLNIRQASLELVRGEEGGAITVEANYDKANYNYSAQVQRLEDEDIYEIELTPKRSSFLLQQEGTRDNLIVLRVPPELLLAVDADVAIGRFDFNLSDLAIGSMDIKGRMGELAVYSETGNPIPLQRMGVRFSMGEVRLDGLELLRAQEVNLRMRMGESRLTLNGPLESDMTLNLDMSMGEANVWVNRATPIRSEIQAEMGEMILPDDAESPQGGSLLIQGKASFGELKVTRQ
jgi:hypothetical protein